jgi:uncharacterized membrane protein YgcG
LHLYRNVLHDFDRSFFCAPVHYICTRRSFFCAWPNLFAWFVSDENAINELLASLLPLLMIFMIWYLMGSARGADLRRRSVRQSGRTIIIPYGGPSWGSGWGAGIGGGGFGGGFSGGGGSSGGGGASGSW